MRKRNFFVAQQKKCNTHTNIRFNVTRQTKRGKENDREAEREFEAQLKCSKRKEKREKKGTHTHTHSRGQAHRGNTISTRASGGSEEKVVEGKGKRKRPQ